MSSVSGRAMLTALAEGRTDPEQLAALADPRIRESAELLAQALTGVDYFDRQDTEAVKRRALKRLADLGYQVTLEPIPR